MEYGHDETHGGAEPTPLPALPARVLAVFVSPADLFGRLAGDPRWFGALLLGVLLVVGSTAVVPAELFARAIRSALLEAGTVPEGFDPEAFGSLQKIFAVVGNGVFWTLWIAGLAGVTAVLFPFLLGDEGGYRAHLAIVAHAALVPAVGSLLVTPLRIVAGDLRLSLHLGLLLPRFGGWLEVFVRSFDLFQMWMLAAIAIGVSRLDPDRGVGSALVLLLALQLLVAAVVATVAT